MSIDVPNDFDPRFTRKVMCFRLSRADYSMLLEMTAAAQEKVPNLTCPDDVCSIILTEFFRQRREKQAAGETPALPGANPS